MENKEYELMSEIQGSHWIWTARRTVIKTLIDHSVKPKTPFSIADVGAGFGANLDLLTQYGDVSALELHEDALKTIQKKWGPRVKTVAWKCPDPLDSKFDLILLADVLEHIPNDREMARWIFDHLKPNGFVLITVPAHKWLWTQMDDFVHHQRRYTKKELKTLFGQLKMIRLSYYHFFLFPLKILFVLYDKIQRIFLPQKPKQSYNETPASVINSLLSLIARGEAELLKFVSFPAGPSLVMLVQKV